LSAPELVFVDLDHGDARALIAALDAELAATYPEEGATHFRLDPAEVAHGRGAFLIARDAGRPVGCGALRLLGDGVAELKRMYTVPAARGRGVAARLLAELERVAAGLGAREIRLETGARQAAALALYRRAGYRPIPAYGEYVGSPLSVCMGKRL
jgi:GNAT superfamily N-acetyltransferase